MRAWQGHPRAHTNPHVEEDMRGLVLATASVIALGLGSAGIANGHGYSGASMPPSAKTMPHTKTSALHRVSRRSITGAAVHRSRTVERAQQALRRDGLYHGRIDGIEGPMTRRAIAQFQRRNGLRVTARLDRSTLASLTGRGAVGVGTSMPPRTRRHGVTHPAPSRAGTSGPSGTASTR
jgi:hypothetical protein